MTPGSLSIRNETKPWSKADIDGYLIVVSIGVLAGVAVAMGRTPLQLPGHKALFWIPPILATRWLTRRPMGATVGSLATVLTTLSLGGRLAGGWTAAPLVLLAGGAMDAIIAIAAGKRPSLLRLTALTVAAGVSANLICFIKRLFEPSGTFWSTSNLHDIAWVAESHALFGLAAGLLAAGVVALIPTRRLSKLRPPSPICTHMGEGRGEGLRAPSVVDYQTILARLPSPSVPLPCEYKWEREARSLCSNRKIEVPSAVISSRPSDG